MNHSDLVNLLETVEERGISLEGLILQYLVDELEVLQQPQNCEDLVWRGQGVPLLLHLALVEIENG